MSRAKAEWGDLFRRARVMGFVVRRCIGADKDYPARVWGVPRGGTHVAEILEALTEPKGSVRAVSRPEDADIAVDEIVDTGATARRVLEEHSLHTVALYDRRESAAAGLRYTAPEWLVFPWEADQEPPEWSGC